jgi:hypothetical protein
VREKRERERERERERDVGKLYKCFWIISIYAVIKVMDMDETAKKRMSGRDVGQNRILKNSNI